MDYMAEMRRKIEEMQERAADSRGCAEAVVEYLLDTVVRSAGFMEEGEVASPEYQPPYSPEYTPPTMEVEVAQDGSWACAICKKAFGTLIFEVFDHLEEEHGMNCDNEEELRKCCLSPGRHQDEKVSEERDEATREEDSLEQVAKVKEPEMEPDGAEDESMNQSSTSTSRVKPAEDASSSTSTSSQDMVEGGSGDTSTPSVDTLQELREALARDGSVKVSLDKSSQYSP